MKLYFLKDDFLETLKTNINYNLDRYKEENNKWIAEYFKEEAFAEFKKEVPDFELRFDTCDENTFNIENVKTLYSSMMDISEAEASDERLWAGLSHSVFWNYMQSRWGLDEDKTYNKENIKTRYFFAHGPRRSLFTNTLARLWWVGRMTYDHRRQDPFELTKLFDRSFIHNSVLIFSSNYNGSEHIRMALLDSLLYGTKQGLKMNDNLIVPLTKYLNVIAGTYILDCLTREEIERKLRDYIDKKLLK